jgi:hypothetical protein
MRRFSTIVAIALATFLSISICSAQQAATTSVPNPVRDSGTLKDAPGSWTQAQVNTSIVNAVAWIDLPAQRHINGSFGPPYPGYPIAQTGMALVAYSVLAQGDFNNLAAYPGYQQHVKDAINYLLPLQNTAGGWWADSGYNLRTYYTGIVLAGLSSFQAVPGAPGVPAAIAKGRTFLINEFKGPPGCNSSNGSSTAYYCGGWNYEDNILEKRSDESNTGWAMFGLQLTGGIPPGPFPGIADDNINWQHHIQEINTNTFFATRNDGGGDYQPDDPLHNLTCASLPYICSNANNTGTMLFGLGYDKVLRPNSNVDAGLSFGQHILDVYELEQLQLTYRMVYHTGLIDDGS